MTRKQAICEAIKILSNDKENQEICQLLQDVHDDYRSSYWSEKAIFDAIDQFIFEKDRFPAKGDFTRKNGLPTVGEIRFKFGIGYGAFRETYYKDVKYYTKKIRYDNVEFWKKAFAEQFLLLGRPTEEGYNKNRLEGMPHSKTLMNNLDCRCWTELLKKCDVFDKPDPILKVTTREALMTEQEYEQLYHDLATQLGIEIEE